MVFFHYCIGTVLFEWSIRQNILEEYSTQKSESREYGRARDLQAYSPENTPYE